MYTFVDFSGSSEEQLDNSGRSFSVTLPDLEVNKLPNVVKERISKLTYFKRFSVNLLHNADAFLGVFMVVTTIISANTAMASLLPSFTLEMINGYSNPYFWIAVVTTSFPMMELPSSAVFGALTDRIGRHAIIIYAPVGVAVSQVLSAIAPNVYVLILARIIGGCFAGSIVATTAWVTDISTSEDLELMYSMLLVGLPFGVIVGSVLTIFLADSLGFRYFSLFIAVVSIVPHIYMFALVMLGRGGKRRVSTEASEGQDVSYASFAPNASTETEKQENHIKLMVSKTKAYAKILLRRKVFFPALSSFLHYFLMYMVFTLTPLYVVDRYHLDPSIYASIAFLLQGIVQMPAAFMLLPIATNVIGTRRSLFVAYLFMGALMIILAFMNNYWLFVGVLIFWYLFILFPTSLQSSLLLEASTESTRGAIAGLINIMQGLGKAFTPFIATMLYSYRDWIPFSVVAPLLTMVILLFQILSIEDYGKAIREVLFIKRFEQVFSYLKGHKEDEPAVEGAFETLDLSNIVIVNAV